MAQTNRERVQKALELLSQGLQPYVAREMEAVHGERWQQIAASRLRTYQADSLSRETGDVQAQLSLMLDQWNGVFGKSLGRLEKAWVSELQPLRNDWAHMKPFSSAFTERTLDTTQLLLTAVSASEEAAEVRQMKQDLQRLREDEQVRNEMRKLKPIEGQPAQGLRPWREVMTPQQDVAENRYRRAEFAADLGEVHRKKGAPEYREPRDFFQRTYLTQGLRNLCSNALARLSGNGGDPIIDLQTNFGGGKTHSLLALYHLFSGTALANLVGLDAILERANITEPLQVQRAVIVGHELTPGQPWKKPDGTIIHTLWGELAWQLLDKDGYAMVAELDRQGISPGSNLLRELFSAAEPCLILIDELVVYFRQLHNEPGASGGSFDANLSFAQALTEAAKTEQRTLIVATIPESEGEKGGEMGQIAAERLERIFGRMDSPWRPADTEESFEIVRRRLFQPILPENEKYQEAVIKAFCAQYRDQPQAFPQSSREGSYEDRMRRAYPIHPELFDFLYSEWSSVERFQRTRGVLRLMATVIRSLWERSDAGLLILPAHMPIEDPDVHAELMQYLENNWSPIMDRDVDGTGSVTLQLDTNYASLGRYSACRRVARTIFMGSAPVANATNRGLVEEQVYLGCVQPGENVPTFGDALRRLSDNATHLYLGESRYWYSTQRSIVREAQERAEHIEDYLVFAEIEKRLDPEAKRKGDFLKVHVCPGASIDVPEDEAVRLVILKPEFSHTLRDMKSSAIDKAREFLNERGNASRNNHNTLTFLVPDRVKLENLKRSVRRFLAWEAICNESESETLNLDAYQRKLARTKRDEENKLLSQFLADTYSLLLVPEQDEKNARDSQAIEWSEARLQQPQLGSLAAMASSRLVKDGQLATGYSGDNLRRVMDRIPLWQGSGDAVRISELIGYFVKHIYLQRLKNADVLIDAIEQGVKSLSWQTDGFAYADGYDEERKRYINLRAGEPIRVVRDGQSMLVKSKVALKQFEAQEEAVRISRANAEAVASNYTSAAAPSVATEHQVSSVLEKPVLFPDAPVITPEVTLKPKTRFHGTIRLDPRQPVKPVQNIAAEVLQHLTSQLDCKVEVTLEIHAENLAGFPEDIQRIIKENCATLKFEKNTDFEEE